MRHRRVIGLILSVLIIVTVFIFYKAHISPTTLPISLKSQVEFKSNKTLEIMGLKTIRINDTEFFLLDEKNEIFIMDCRGNMIIQKLKNSEYYVYKVLDLNNDGSDEIIAIEPRDTNRVLHILTYKLESILAINLPTSTFFDIGFYDYDEDNRMEIFILEGFMGDPSGALKIYDLKGSIVLEYEVSDERISDEEYYALYYVKFTAGELNGDDSDEVIAFISFARKTWGAYYSDYHTHVIAISKEGLLWEKVYDIGPLFFYFDTILVYPGDIDKDGNSELVVASYYEGYLGLGVINEVGDLHIWVTLDVGSEFISSHAFTFYDYDNDSYEDAIWTFSINYDALIIIMNVRTKDVNIIEIGKLGEPEGVIYYPSEVFFIFNNRTGLIYVTWNGSIYKIVHLNTTEISMLMMFDVNDDGINDIIITGQHGYDTKLYVIDSNGTIMSSFSIISHFYFWTIIHRNEDFYIAIGAASYVYIYSSEGNILKSIADIEILVPRIGGPVITHDMDNDGEKELLVVASSAIFIYDLTDNTVSKLKVPPLEPPVVSIIPANLDGDELKDIVIMDRLSYTLLGVLRNNTIAFITPINNTNRCPLKLLTCDIDHDTLDEIIILNQLFTGDVRYLVEVYDHNGSLLYSFRVSSEDAYELIYFGSIMYKGHQEIFLATQRIPWNYLFRIYAPNGSILWDYVLSLYYKSAPISILVGDLDEDEDYEVVLTSFEIYHVIRLIEIDYGEKWKIMLDHPNITSLGELKKTIDNLEVITWHNEKSIGLSYIYTASSEIYTRFLIIDLNGSILLDRYLMPQSIGSKQAPYYTRFWISNGKIYGIIGFVGVSYGVGDYTVTYYISVYELLGRRSKLFKLPSKLQKVIILDADNDNLIEVICIRNYRISVLEIVYEG